MQNWLYNEFIQVGKDYTDTAEVEMYDSSHADFRDFDKENISIANQIGLKPTDTIIDYGCGTANFAIYAASVCKNVVAADVSEEMLRLAEKKARHAGIFNIDFKHGGFLTIDYPEHSFDTALTVYSFHHLPDYWKGIALQRINRQLKPGGILYMHDVIMQDGGSLENIQKFIDKQYLAGGDFLKDDAEQHFREEFSTYEWILDELLERSGFRIKEKWFEEGVLGTYVCIKNDRLNKTERAKWNYNNLAFRAVENSENGEVSEKTAFHYKQEGNIISADYAGGTIRQGHLIGTVDDDGIISMRYHHLNREGTLLTGRCRSTPERLPDGRIRLHENWQWTSGREGSGRSIIEQT